MQVPSAYFMTDVWLMVDKLLKFKLIKPVKKEGQTKMSLAAVEALKTKRLMGALRALWRSSKEQGFNPRVTELKSYLRPSPVPQRQAPQDESSSECSDGEPHGDEGDRRGGSDEDDEDDTGDEGCPSEDDGHDVASNDDGGERDEDEANQVVAHPMCSSQDSVTAETWVLGDGSGSSLNEASEEEISSSSSQEDEEVQMGDSQVSSGWLGKAYNVYNNIEKEEKAETEKKDFEAEVHKMVSDVIEDLEGQLGTSIDDTDAGDAYKAHCHKAFKQYGHQGYGHLSCLESFTSWIEKQEEKKAGGFR